VAGEAIRVIVSKDFFEANKLTIKRCKFFLVEESCRVKMMWSCLGETNYPAIQQWNGARLARLSLAAENQITCIVQLLIPAFDWLPPNHHVTNEFLTLPIHPLFHGPERRDGDRQQEYRAEDGDSDILRVVRGA
jgi:hypothetical protein